MDMEMSYEQAKEFFRVIDDNRKSPSQDPDYLVVDASREKELEPTYFIYEENGDIYYHAFHIGRVPGTDYFDIQSPYGYGGPIATTMNSAFLERAWRAYTDWCQQKRVLAEFIRFHPILQNWRYYQGEHIFDRETVWVDLTADNLFEQYQTRARRKIRKAVKNGLTVEWTSYEDFFRWFPTIYEELMRNLQADSFYFFSESYYRAWKQSRNARFALCKLGKQVVGAVIIYHNKNIMEYHLSAANELGKELSATSLVIHEAALLGKRIGCQKLHLGGGTNNSLDNSLFFFKSGFSDRRGNFRIGKRIFLPEAYEEIKRDWIQKTGNRSNRVLFYRT